MKTSPNFDVLIFTSIHDNMFLAMQETVDLPNRINSKCRVCGHTQPFNIKSPANEFLTPLQEHYFEEALKIGYLKAKRSRLESWIKSINVGNDVSLSNFINNFDYNEIRYGVIKFGFREVETIFYEYGDNFPIKELKYSFKRLKIALIAKRKGGGDE